jgi:dihydrofolate reductase
MSKVVFSNMLRSDADRRVVGGDIAAELADLKRQDGEDIFLSCGPAILAPLADTPGLVDEYLLAVNPAVLASGPRVFDGISADFTLELAEAKVFDAGALVLRYRVAQPQPDGRNPIEGRGAVTYRR